ncbi:MAG: class II fructose-bisphosphate aldolase, partial [Armatimonadota bacterium]
LMIDGSRLDLEGNIEKTSLAVEMAHHADLPCEAELGAVFGHEDGPRPSYEELFSSGRGFTNVEQARRFVNETGCDWLSVAVGTVHGAISGTDKDRKKVEARIDLDHLAKLAEATGIPLVLHGGSSVNQEYVLEAMKLGIAKINIATEIRQAYEFTLRDTDDTQAAQKSVYDRTGQLLSDYLGLSGTRHRVVQ